MKSIETQINAGVHCDPQGYIQPVASPLFNDLPCVVVEALPLWRGRKIGADADTAVGFRASNYDSALDGLAAFFGTKDVIVWRDED